MFKYEVKFISKDGQVFRFTTEKENELDAVEACTNSLIEKGWLHQYGYEFQSIDKV